MPPATKCIERGPEVEQVTWSQHQVIERLEVPGGWLYTVRQYHDDTHYRGRFLGMTSVFVANPK